jgi:hypothetical protein
VTFDAVEGTLAFTVLTTAFVTVGRGTFTVIVGQAL